MLSFNAWHSKSSSKNLKKESMEYTHTSLIYGAAEFFLHEVIWQLQLTVNVLYRIAQLS